MKVTHIRLMDVFIHAVWFENIDLSNFKVFIIYI